MRGLRAFLIFLSAVGLTATLSGQTRLMQIPASGQTSTSSPNQPTIQLSPAPGQTATASAPGSAAGTEFDVKPGDFLDTGIDVGPGDTLKITATGEVRYANAQQAATPDGLRRGFADLIRAMPVNEAGRGALVGRIGSNAAARAFLVGSRTETKAPVAGRLFLGVNQPANDSGSGSFHVKLERTAAPVMTKALDVPLPKVTQGMIDSLPRRVSDPDGAPGDRVNFVVVGSQDKMQAAFKAAGWVTVDRSKQDALIRGALATFSKQAYVTLPMSELQLFGRSQDFGYAQGDPLRVIASRHHFRIWKAPFAADSQVLWAGAGTHDIGFDRDQRNGNLTHKIDPDVDGERDYIRDSLMQTGLVAKVDYITPKDPITTAKTAHGEEFHSDGRTLIVWLQPDSAAVGASFGDMFCSVLKQNNPDGGNWGPCSRYLESPGKEDTKLAAFSTQNRVLIVPGFMSSCFADSPAFLEGQQALKQKYNLDVDLLTVPNDESEANAKVIAQYLAAHKGGAKYILVGYSKGTPDIQTALAKEPGVADQVAAFVSVAGASGGSPIADLLPGVLDKYMGMNPMKGCKGDMATGFKSLKREVRQAFLKSYPQNVVPTYSIIARSDADTTSKSLQQTWRLLSTYGAPEDGQLLKDDAVIPGSKYLGAAVADHFAIALPFDKSSDAAIKSGMDKAAFPRGALLESLLRFVAADLGQ